MVQSKNIVKEAVKSFEAESGVLINNCYLFKNKMFSETYVLEGDDGVSYVIKIGTTARSIKREFDFYQYLNSINIETLQPVFFNQDLNALVTIKRDIEPIYKTLSTLKRGRRFDFLLVKVGEFCRLIEERSAHKPLAEDRFHFENVMLEKINSCFFVKNNLSEEIKAWLSANAYELDATSKIRSFSTDFNFYNLHADISGKLVLVDMGDSHFMPNLSNLAYLYLQFKFNRPKGSYLKTGDFYKVLEGYGGSGFYNTPLCSYFQIYHLIDMMDYYQLLVDRMPKLKAMPIFVFYRIFRIQPLINEVKRIIRTVN